MVAFIPRNSEATYNLIELSIDPVTWMISRVSMNPIGGMRE